MDYRGIIEVLLGLVLSIIGVGYPLLIDVMWMQRWRGCIMGTVTWMLWLLLGCKIYCNNIMGATWILIR